MREVGGEDEERPAVVEPGEPPGEGALEGVVGVAHEHGHEAERPERRLQEGELDLHRVLALGDPGDDARLLARERRGGALAERDVADRGAVGSRVVEGEATERAVVGGRDDDHAPEVPGPQEAEGGGRGQPRVVPARVRHDEGDRGGGQGRGTRREAHEEVGAGDEVRTALGVPGPGQGRGARARRLGGPGAEGRGSGGEGATRTAASLPDRLSRVFVDRRAMVPPARLGPSRVILGGPDANEPFDPAPPAFRTAAHGASAR